MRFHWCRDLTLEPTGLFLPENDNRTLDFFLDFVFLLFYRIFLTCIHMILRLQEKHVQPVVTLDNVKCRYEFFNESWGVYSLHVLLESTNI